MPGANPRLFHFVRIISMLSPKRPAVEGPSFRSARNENPVARPLISPRLRLKKWTIPAQCGLLFASLPSEMDSVPGCALSPGA